MSGKSYYTLRKCILVFIMLVAGLFTACGREEPEFEDNMAESEEPETIAGHPEKNTAMDDSSNYNENGVDIMENENAATDTKEDAAREEELKKRFGEDCIIGQTFEVTLSEYNEKVWFVPFYPSEEEPEYFYIQIIQDGEVLSQNRVYAPENLKGQAFSSLDAVSFFDANYDSNTDIILIATYGTTSFVKIYYGFDSDAEEMERHFSGSYSLAEMVTEQIEILSIPQIRNFLTEGKENGKFSGYEEAYEAISRICELESGGEMQYNLIYFDDDDIPELAVGVSGYYTSLYTYHDGTLYKVMERWPYGISGNAGYEFSPKKNSLRYLSNYGGGVIRYLTYGTIGEEYSMDTVALIEEYNFDDVNKNGQLDEDEMDSLGVYEVTYINGVEASDEECASYDLGDYEYIRLTMNREELIKTLSEK
ncbi:MAG: hypothetical protein HDR00_05210 [Lachnospiraceae bacterium]|nr:hypothetical protein [Lachnospiraceae bacterium]